MTKDEILEIFNESGAMLKGHFRLTSGKHSNQYMQCAKLFVDPNHSERLCGALARKLEGLAVDYVVSPAVGGIIMGYIMAKNLGVSNVFAERVDGSMSLRRGFSIPRGARVLVVEDVVTTGGSVKEVIELIRSLGANTIAVASIVDRSSGNVDFQCYYYSLLEIDIPTWEENDCPMCMDGQPIEKPGSRHLVELSDF